MRPADVCASLPSKPYPTVGRRKLFDEKGAVGPPEFAPHPRQSLILPSAGANPLVPAESLCARLTLRLPPVKALSHRRQAQTLRRERRRAPARVCAFHPSKPYPTVGRRKPFGEKGTVGPPEFALLPSKPDPTVGRRKPSGEKGAVGLPEFAPHPRQSLIPPSAGANPLARKAAGANCPARPCFFSSLHCEIITRLCIMISVY